MYFYICILKGVLAQLVERLNGIQKVRSSILLCSTSKEPRSKAAFFFVMASRDRKLLNIELSRVSKEAYKELPESGIVMVLDNIRSAHNVGSAFRTADAFKADKIFLCGICACPPSAEMHKTALGAEDSVPWEYFKDTLNAIQTLREEGYTIISVEQTVKSVSLDKFEAVKGEKYALVFGNEVDGVRQDVVDASDMSLEIPQFGSKHSLNVSVSIGVVLWHIKNQLI